MERAEYAEFATVLGALAETFNEALSEQRALLYFGALDDLPIASVREAAMAAARSCRFFPRPVELRDLAISSPDDRALAAWARVETALREVGTYQSVTFEDAVLHATLDQMGGWASAWPWERLDERDYGFKRLEFTRLYRMLERGTPRPIRYLPGQQEITNRMLRGGWRVGAGHVDQIVRIGLSGEAAGALAEPERLRLRGETTKPDDVVV